MAQELDDGEFWLPSQFLSDDDFEEKKIDNTQVGNTEIRNGFCFPSEFPYEFDSFGSSAISSTVQSAVSSTETESDEEDYLSGLTKKMDRTTLEEVQKNSKSVLISSETPKLWVVCGSPESTLCGSWSAGSRGSSGGSPNGPSQVSSPPTTMNQKEDAWELLYAAAGEVVKMKMNDEVDEAQNNGKRLVSPPRKPTPIPSPVKNPNRGVSPNQSKQKLQKPQLKLQQKSDVKGKKGKHAKGTKQNHQNPRNGVTPASGFVNGGNVPPLGLSSSAWPPLQSQSNHQHQQPQPHQQNPSSGIGPVYPGEFFPRRESSGTGVFLPRQISRVTDTRKKPTFSTVHVPARVAKALNLTFEEKGVPKKPLNGGYSLDHDAMVNRNNLKQNQGQVTNPEIKLPQEWTY